ncbi:glycosyltransferase family 39 protein [Paenibacillus sp. MZ04-78.2]|uniref:ArnT family glycosyltransferase n=1 Tax=Paenibacillus sp. MZ04-78.2 TaxID=2962034 RepID=UPI0020B7D5D5|nr:glycosyltransferase family 39 protein [Paenibacillus sp. MZ04-78.2]MCP3773756.1 glycosyltransferase family 39 protein [Paenibacillus sp. MZ04-78.2]
MFFSYLKEAATKRFLLILSSIVFLISIIVVLVHGDRLFLGDPIKLDNDDVKYIHSARVLLNEGTLVYNSGNDPSAFIMPGLTMILSGFMAIFGEQHGGVTAFRIFQAFLQAICIFPVYYIARYTFNHWVAIITSLLVAVYLPDYFTSGSILTESIFRFIVLVLLCVMITALHTKKTSWYIGVGLLTASAAYFKPQASLFPGIMLILWLCYHYSFKEIVRFTLTIIAAYIVLLIPWWIRNYITFGHFILFTSSAGSPFLLGTQIRYGLPPDGFFAAYPQYDPSTIFTGADQVAVAKGLDVLKYGLIHEPLNYINHYTIGRLRALYLVPFYLHDIFSIKKNIVENIQTIIVRGGLIGMFWACVRKTGKSLLPILLTLFYFTAIQIPFVAMSRYGYPVMTFFILLTSYMIYQVILIFRKAFTTKNNHDLPPHSRHESGV